VRNEVTSRAGEQMRAVNYRVMFDVEDDHWWFVGRRAIVISQIEHLIRAAPQTSSRRLLDIGCGTGATITHLRKYGVVHGIDMSPLALGYCHERGECRVVCASATDLPFHEGTFDIVTALDVIEHLDDDRRGVSEIHRVLKPGGTALIFVPAFQALWGPNDTQTGHKRRYQLEELRELIANGGLNIRMINYANVAMFLPIWLGRKMLNLLGKSGQAENEINHPALNRILTRIFVGEASLLDRFRFPFGVSIICVAQKPES
jgi:SAM-dependent methyltransferase